MSSVGDIMRIYLLVVGALAVLTGTFLGLIEVSVGLPVQPIIVLLAMGILYLVGFLLIYLVIMPAGHYVLRPYSLPARYGGYRPWTARSAWVDGPGAFPVYGGPGPWEPGREYPGHDGGRERPPHGMDRDPRDWTIERPYGRRNGPRRPGGWPWSQRTYGSGWHGPEDGHGRLEYERDRGTGYFWEWHSADERIPMNRWDLPEPRPLFWVFLFSIVAGTVLLITGRMNPYLYLGFPAAFVIAFSFPSLMWISYTYWNQFDPEPRRAMLIALTWGMLSLNIALLAEALVPTADLFVLVVVAAPVIEELVKPIGLLVLRRWINTPLQGLVYGVACGMGFAMVENLLYESYFLYTDIQVTELPILWGTGSLARGLLSTLGHAVGTGLIGYAYGVYRREKLAGELVEFVGPGTFMIGSIALAIGLHAAWNASAYLTETVSIWLISVPLMVAAVNFIILIRLTRRARRHGRRIRVGYRRFAYLPLRR